MNILPKKNNVMLKLTTPEAPKQVITEEKPVLVQEDPAEESEEEVVISAPINEQIFKQVEEGLKRPPNPPPGNIIEAEPDKPKKKKKQLSEKQLAHLARMRAKALEKRKKLKAQKEAEKEKKRIAKEKKREAKALVEAKRRAKKEEKKKQTDTIRRETEQMKPLSSTNPDEDFAKFFNYMERYDRIKNVRHRQSQRPTRNQTVSLNQTPQQPKNKYLGSMIPF